MFRKIAVAAVALCALASTASAAMMKVVDITNYAVQDDDGTAPIILKPNTVYDFNTPDDDYYYVTVQCPAPKNTNAKTQRAFNSYITVSNKVYDYALYVIDANTGYYLAELWGIDDWGDGSSLTITCVNGRITCAYNYY